MARTKPAGKPPERKKSRRTKGRRTMPVKKTYTKAIYQNMGGFLFCPPDDCLKKIEAPDGGVWTDFCLCGSWCEDKCERWREASKMSHKEQIDDLKNRGVKFTELLR